MTRINATLSHLLLSVLIFSIVIAILIFVWYPAPHFTASGGWQGLKIAAGVDLVLGPLLMLIVFDITKSRKKLMGDLMVIVLLQFFALAWGVYTIYGQRPVAVVFWEQEFITVPAVDILSQNVSLARLEEFGSQLPVLIYAQKPRNLEELKKMSKRIAEDAVAPHHQMELYRPLKEYYNKIKPLQVDINEIITFSSRMKADLMVILSESNTDVTDYDYFPLRSKYHTIILLFSDEGELKNYIIVPVD